MPAHRVRVALIGLSASAKTAWASKAHLPYLLSPRDDATAPLLTPAGPPRADRPSGP